MISMIVATDVNRAIGGNNSLLWDVKEDLNFFRKITTGKTVVMGQKTYESIGRPLPKRENIILCPDLNYRVEGCTVFHSVGSVLEYAKTKDVVIIGGGMVYKTFLPYVDTLYVTQLDLSVPVEDVDTYFPPYEDDFELLIKGEQNYSKEQDCLFSFNLWKRKP